jgi:hypothetical protein
LYVRGASSCIQEYCTRPRLLWITSRVQRQHSTDLGGDMYVLISCAACNATIDVSNGHCHHTCSKAALLAVSSMVQDGLVALDTGTNVRSCKLCGCRLDQVADLTFHACYSTILTHFTVSGHSIHSVAFKTMMDPVLYGITKNNPEESGCGMYISVNELYNPSPGQDPITFTTVLIAPTPQLDKPGGRPNVGMFALSRGDGNFIMAGDIIMLYVGHTSNPGSLSEGNDRNACEIRTGLGFIRIRVDPTIYGNLVHKANQACGYLKNAYIKHPEIADSVLGSQTVHMSMLVASDTILPGTEICYYYGQTTNNKSEEEACLCHYCQPPGDQRLPKDRESKGKLCAFKREC